MASNAVANSSSMAANASHSAPLAAPVAVPTAYKKLVVLLAHMFYAGQCPPAWWVDASEPKKQISQAEAEMALFQEKKASQLAREAKRKAQASEGELHAHCSWQLLQLWPPQSVDKQQNVRCSSRQLAHPLF